MRKTYELKSLSELTTRFRVGKEIIPVQFTGALKGMVRRGGRFSTDNVELQKVMESDVSFNSQYMLVSEEKSKVDEAAERKKAKEEEAKKKEEARLKEESDAKLKAERDEEKKKLTDELTDLESKLETAVDEDKPGIQEKIQAKKDEISAKFPREIVDHPEFTKVFEAREYLIGLKLEGVNEDTLPNKDAVVSLGLKNFISFSKLKK